MGKRAEKLRNAVEGIEYIRFRDKHNGIERGSVIIGKRTIVGFPHIRRIFTLTKGLLRNMKAEKFYAEEKIDGFNIRIAFIEGEIYAFSRGGFLDSFVTEKAREMDLEKFFADFPDYVICAEMIGNTPYTVGTNKFDVKMFIFGIVRGDGAHLTPDERYQLVKKYMLSGVPVIGCFSHKDRKKLVDAIIEINNSSKEGIVFKSLDNREIVKYVTPQSDIEDIAKSSSIFFDMPIGFYHQRILRSAFFMSDFQLPKKKYVELLGRAFYDGLEQSLKKAADGKEIDEEFEIRIKNPKIWDDILGHMSREVSIEELERKVDGKWTRIKFRKIYKKTTRILKSYVNGKGIED